MRNVNHKFSSKLPSRLFPSGIHGVRLRKLAHLFILLLTFNLSSCFKQYYQLNTNGKAEAANLSKLQGENRYFIVHTPDGIYALNNEKVADDVLSGNLSPLAPPHDKYLDPKVNRSNVYRRIDKSAVLSEVHVYTNMIGDSIGHLNLPISQIFRIDVYEMDKATTKQAFIGSLIFLIGVPAAVIIGAATTMQKTWGMGLPL